MAKHVDEMAFIHSCWTDSNNHSPALFKMNTGMTRMGFPCVGSWVTYGLGSESQNLPAFCVMYDTLGRGMPKGHAPELGRRVPARASSRGPRSSRRASRSTTSNRPPDMSDAQQRAQLDLLAEAQQGQPRRAPGEPDLAARDRVLRAGLPDADGRAGGARPRPGDEETKQLYGLDNPKATHFAKQCLIARRLVERGVRFVQIYSGGMENELSWDGHNNIAKNHGGFAGETDQPIAGLLADLDARGLLDSTLVIWGGEFGRLPIVQKGSSGRDHNPHAFTVWMAGGGVKGGVTTAATDEIGFKAVEDRVSINDLHATMLHLLGLDHKRLTYRYNGRDFRLTDVAGTVVEKILAVPRRPGARLLPGPAGR